MSRIKIHFICSFFLLWSVSIYTQSLAIYNKDSLTIELQKRNLDYDEVQKRLLEEGYNIENLNPNTLTVADKERIENILLEMSQSAPAIEKVSKESQEEVKPIVITEPEITSKQNSAAKIPSEIYGQNLFRENILKLIDNSNQLKAPESYILGQGDQVVVSIWGRSQLENSYTIQADGFIKLLDGRERVYVKGLSVSQTRSKLRRVLSEFYSFNEGEFDIAVNYSRTVRISIYGEVLGQAGSYSVSGFNSAFNALTLVKGPSNIGSLRNIKLQKNNGQSLTLDVYAFMNDPSVQSEYFLEDNDIILVPVADKVVKVTGAVRRPFKYELKNNEKLSDLIDFAGGFSENAYLRKLQIKRYVNHEQKIFDIDWTEYLSLGNDFELLNGDDIYVEDIEKAYRNFVSITGELNKPGEYERFDNMRIFDVVQRAGLTPNSNLDIIFLIRSNADGTNELIKLNLQAILDDPTNPQNIILRDLDKLEVWSQERFADEARISVSGAVRYGGEYPYDQNGGLRVTDAVIMAGGLRSDASLYATIHYNDPLNKKKKYYKTIDNLFSLFDQPEHPNNFLLNAFDSLVIQSVNKLEEAKFVRIEGAVNNPGQFQFGDGMSIKDLLILAGGFQQDASMNNIEISRVLIKDNKPTQIVVANLEMDRAFQVLTKGVANGEYELQAFDNISVKYIKDFKFQERVFVYGEVAVPGPYAIYEKNLKISSIIERAGGLTSEAFAGGATLIRNKSNLGALVIKLDEVLRNPRSEFNFILRDGDEIFIPKVNDFVTIKGATRVKYSTLNSNIDDNNLIRVPYHEGKNALFYINEFAGGFDEKADKLKVFVEYANGEIKQAKPGFLKRKYPQVRQGSIITVGYQEVEKMDEEKSSTDWSKVLSDSVGQALSILTLILLVQRID